MKDVCSPINKPKGPTAGSPAQLVKVKHAPDVRRWRVVETVLWRPAPLARRPRSVQVPHGQHQRHQGLSEVA